MPDSERERLRVLPVPWRFDWLLGRRLPGDRLDDPEGQLVRIR